MEASKVEKQVHALIRGEHGEWRNLYNVWTKQCSTKLIPELTNKNICTCSYGWLLLQDDANLVDYSLFHFESNNKEMVKLPTLESPFDVFYCLLFLPPNHPDCRVVLHDDISATLWVCKPGTDDKFVKQDIWPEELVPSFIDFQGQPYCCFFDDDGDPVRLTRIEFVGSEIVFLDSIETPWDQDTATYGCRSWLVASNDDILLVRTMHFGFEHEVDGCRVYRLDFEKREWTRMRSIGDMAIFVSHEHSTGTCCCVAATEYGGVEPNSIYFTHKWQDRHFYMFSLEDQSITMTLPCPTITRRCYPKLQWIIL